MVARTAPSTRKTRSRRPPPQNPTRRTRATSRAKQTITTWSAPEPDADEFVEDSAPEQEAAPVWQAPVRPVRKKVVRRQRPPTPPPAKKISPRDLDESVLEQLTEEEIIGFLQVLSTESPEAFELLEDVRLRLDELRRMDNLRQI